MNVNMCLTCPVQSVKNQVFWEQEPMSHTWLASGRGSEEQAASLTSRPSAPWHATRLCCIPLPHSVVHCCKLEYFH